METRQAGSAAGQATSGQGIAGKIQPMFTTYPLNGKGEQRDKAITHIFNDAWRQLIATCPDGPALVIVKDKLEEACFYAKASLVTQQENIET